MSLRFTEQELERLSKEIGTEWQGLGISLLIKHARIQQFQQDNKHNVANAIFKMCIEWQQNLDANCNSFKLMEEALKENGRQDLATKIELRQGFKGTKTTDSRGAGRMYARATFPEVHDGAVDEPDINDKHLQRNFRFLGNPQKEHSTPSRIFTEGSHNVSFVIGSHATATVNLQQPSTFIPTLDQEEAAPGASAGRGIPEEEGTIYTRGDGNTSLVVGDDATANLTTDRQAPATSSTNARSSRRPFNPPRQPKKQRRTDEMQPSSEEDVEILSEGIGASSAETMMTGGDDDNDGTMNQDSMVQLDMVKKVLTKSNENICRNLNPKPLLGIMLREEALTPDDVKLINSKVLERDQSAELLSTLMRKKEKSYIAFMDALLEIDRKDIFDSIEGFEQEVGYIRPRAGEGEDSVDNGGFYNDLKYSDMEFGDSIGSGSVGEVFEATFINGSFRGYKKVAAKQLVKKIDENEVNILKRVRHKNIIKLLAYVEEKLVKLIVMELADQSLRKFLDDYKGKVPTKWLNRWVKEVCDALQYLHEGVVMDDGRRVPVLHRDIKASNCLLFKRGSSFLLKLADFSIARKFNHTTTSKTGKGSLVWMAPEVFDGIVSEKSDIYSLGVLFWEMFTQKEPEMDSNKTIGDQQPPLCDEIPQHMRDIISHCWRKNREERPTIQEVKSMIL